MKAKLRFFVYKYNILITIWKSIINFRDKYQFLYWEIYNKFYFSYLIKRKGYKELTFEKKIVNGMFKVFLQKETNTVIKIIRKDNSSSNKFYRHLKKKGNFQKYHNIITSASNMKILGPHISNVTRIYRNGGYESPYTEGENLQVIKLQLQANELGLSNNEYHELMSALDTIYAKLVLQFKEYGFLSGDWMLYNLIYDKKDKTIIMVDLEGFYTRNGKQIEIPNNLERIKGDFEDIKSLIKRQELVIADDQFKKSVM